MNYNERLGFLEFQLLESSDRNPELQASTHREPFGYVTQFGDLHLKCGVGLQRGGPLVSY